MLYEGRNDDVSSYVRVDASDATRSNATLRWSTTTACPSSSIPRRPARPVSWVYSPGVSSSLHPPRPGRHVDPERQRLGGEHDLPQSRLEQLLDRLLEHGQHPRVVRRDPGRQARPE